MNRVRTKNEEETREVARKIAADFLGGEVLMLYGNLGAGKTAFTKGIAEALGVAREVNSPTFIIHRTYRADKNQITTLHHIDLYRIEDKNDIEQLGLKSIFDEPRAVTVIEWAERLEGSLPKKRIEVHMSYISEHERDIVITNE